MANAQVNLSFLENDRGGLYNGMYLLHAWYKFSVRTIQSTDLLHNILCSLWFNNYFVVMILNNGMMIWKKLFFCQTKGFLHGKKILVQYTYNGNKYVYMNVIKS